MANNKNKIKELVSDDEDPTAELEALAFTDDVVLEADANTFNFVDEDDRQSDAALSELQSDLKDRSETISRLQFDIEQLRSRWLGLEAEIKSREEITNTLQATVEEHEQAAQRKQKLLKKRDERIKSLKAEIRDRENKHQSLQSDTTKLDQTISEQATQLEELRAQVDERDTTIESLQEQNEALSAELSTFSKDEIEATQSTLAVQAGRLASDAAQIRELQQQLTKNEEYTDTIRQMLSDMLSSNEDVAKTREQLQDEIRDANSRIDELSGFLEESSGHVADITEQLALKDMQHEDEIRILRFELGEAQETVANSDTLNEQLASDLFEARSSKDDLERTLEDHDRQNQQRIDELDEQVNQLTAESDELRHKLEGKTEAINCLLEEVAKKSEQLDSIGEIKNVIHDIDDRMSESIDSVPPVPKDRVTRLLVGEVDDQTLRFPLFKDRLTIGRTSSNDIQLKAQYVSRRHAVVLTEGETTRVVDWGSKNGVYVNSRRITEHFLKNGDVVTIGTAEFRYEERSKRD